MWNCQNMNSLKQSHGRLSEQIDWSIYETDASSRWQHIMSDYTYKKTWYKLVKSNLVTELKKQLQYWEFFTRHSWFWKENDSEQQKADSEVAFRFSVHCNSIMMIKKQEKEKVQLTLKSAVNSSMMLFLYLFYKICKDSILAQKNNSCMSVKLKKRNLCKRIYSTWTWADCFMQCGVAYSLLYKSASCALLKMYTQISWLYGGMALSWALARTVILL